MGEKINDETPLLATLSGKPLSATALSQVFVRLSEKIGFMTSPHRFRKFFESHLGLSAPSILVKSWMGHALGVEAKYFLPPLEKQREKYVEAYKEIDLFKPEVNALELRKQSIRDNARVLYENKQITEEVYQGIVNPLEKISSMKAIDEHLENHMAYYRKKDPCEDGKCQKIIGEEELQDHLTKGWRFVATLPSGKLLVSDQ
jgi:hypothetical protein